jgi:SAM-dependent methyltransferase
MVNAFNQKAQALHSTTPATPPPHISNIVALCHDLKSAEDAALQATAMTLPSRIQEEQVRRFDLVTSVLTLHHLPDPSTTLAALYGCLRPGGYIALVDFEDTGPESVLFHPESKREGVERHGIKQGDLEGWISKAGFKDVKVEVSFKILKDVEEEGGQREFPFLLGIGRRLEANEAS